MGSCTIGEDDGRAGGKAVVDLDTKVYGVSISLKMYEDLHANIF
jgi:hypothetical protein